MLKYFLLYELFKLDKKGKERNYVDQNLFLAL